MAFRPLLPGILSSGGGDPMEYIGAVTKIAANSSGWDASGEAPDILAIADVGDLVVVHFYFTGTVDATWSWEGMPFTDIVNVTGSIPGHYIGYRFVEAGDSNPYLSGLSFAFSGLSAVFSVYRNVTAFVDHAIDSPSFSSAAKSIPALTANGQLWVAISGASNGAVPTAAPTDYTLAGAINNFSNSSAAQAYRFTDAASQDPDAFNQPTSTTQFTALLAFEGPL